MPPPDDALSELLYGAVLLDDGVKYYADWASAMQREFHGAASRLPRIFEMAKQLAELEMVRRPEGARQMLGVTPPAGSVADSNPYATPGVDEPIVAQAVENHARREADANRVAALEQRIRQLETRLDKSMLHSERFGYRVLAVVGHWLIAYVLIGLAIGIVLALMNR